jgi:ABC-type branched-subunit amino acid transport system ATPase component
MYVETYKLTKSFGGVVALDNVSLEFEAGQITAVIGPNGAGKTTLFNAIAGFIQTDSGSVRLIEDDGATTPGIELTGLRPQEIARRGVGVLFQDIRIFGHLTALENVAVGERHQLGENPLLALLRPNIVAKEELTNLAASRQHLDFVGLGNVGHLWAGNLSFGQQKLVALARLIASDARVIMLDEPTSGIHPAMIDTLLGLIERLAHEHGKVIIIVEHNLNVVRRVGDWVYLMTRGRAEVFGKPSEVLRDDSLTSIYPSN